MSIQSFPGTREYWGSVLMHISSLLQEKKFEYKKPVHDFQLIGKEISDWCGKPCYFLFSQYHHEKIKDAFQMVQKRDNHSVSYLIGIIKNLK